MYEKNGLPLIGLARCTPLIRGALLRLLALRDRSDRVRRGDLVGVGGGDVVPLDDDVETSVAGLRRSECVRHRLGRRFVE